MYRLLTPHEYNVWDTSIDAMTQTPSKLSLLAKLMAQD